MGDRGNILVKMHDEKAPGYIYLYSHWTGHELPIILQAALKKEWRWHDESYLTRIIFQEMVGNDKGETGYGISTYECDNNHSYLVVNCQEQTVTLAPRKKPEDSIKRWTFKDFIKLDIKKEFGDF